MLFTISTGGLMKALRVKSLPITIASFQLLTKKEKKRGGNSAASFKKCQ